MTLTEPTFRNRVARLLRARHAGAELAAWTKRPHRAIGRDGASYWLGSFTAAAPGYRSRMMIATGDDEHIRIA